MVKINLGELFKIELPKEKEPFAEPLFELPILTEKEVNSWTGRYGRMNELIVAGTDVSYGLRATGAILNSVHPMTGKTLCFIHKERLYKTNGVALMPKVPFLLSSLRAEGGDKIRVVIVEKIGQTGRRYYDFKTWVEEEQPQGTHKKEEMCFSRGTQCMEYSQGGRLICTRERGHHGLHHGATMKGLNCYGSWK
jgi:hypothetical protein